VAADTWTAVADMPVERERFGAVSMTIAAPAEGQDCFEALIAKMRIVKK
jgi:hypothetical protein